MSVRSLWAALVLGCLAAGCGMMAGRQERKEAEVIGERLVAAGFRPVPADTPAKQAQLAKMPNLLFTSTTNKQGQRRYLLADPDRCRCLYIGDDADYQRYTNLELGQEEKTSLAAQKRADRQAGLNDAAPDIVGYELEIESQE
jgi:hypothetical protein